MAEAKRADIVAAKVGDMLMKGYKMLGDSCSVCNNVLMQDKKGGIHCVNCEMSNSNKDELGSMDVDGKPDSNNAIINGAKRKLDMSVSIDTLLTEIETATKAFSDPTMQINKMISVKYIRECAETIRVLQNISS